MGDGLSGSNSGLPVTGRSHCNDKILEPRHEGVAGKETTLRSWAVESLTRAFKWLQQPRHRNAVFTISVTIVIASTICFEVLKRGFPSQGKLEDPRYLIARRSISSGENVSFSDFGLSFDNPKGAADAVTDQDLELLKGATLYSGISEGAVLLKSQLNFPGRSRSLAQRIPKGRRAYSVEIDEPVRLNAGDRIDLILASDQSSSAPLNIVEAALVLDAGFRKRRFEVVVALNTEEIRMLEIGRQRGKLRVALRHPDDASMLKRSTRKLKVTLPKIEVITEKGMEEK